MSYFNFELPPSGAIATSAGTIGLSLVLSGTGASTGVPAAGAVDTHDPGPVRYLSPAAKRALWRKADAEQRALDEAVAARIAERRLLRTQIETAASNKSRSSPVFDHEEEEAELALLLMHG